MTVQQRKMHLVLWLVLGPVILMGLVAAVALRPGTAVQQGVLPGVTGTDAPLDARPDVSEPSR